jgi:parallel beta-helix repeat protein
VGNVITFKPEPATGTVFIRHPSSTEISGGAIITGQGKRYIRIEGLTFKDSKSATGISMLETNSAVDFNGVDTTVYGWEIVNNTFDNCGPSVLDPVTVEQIKGVRARDITVSGNTFINSAGYGISPDNSYRWTVTGNSDDGRRKHRPSWAPFVQSAFSWQNGVCCATPGSTHKTGGYFTYSDNVIGPATSGQLSSGIRLDAGAHNSTFLRNKVSGHVFGIYLEAGANLNLVQENIVYNGQDVTIGASNFKSSGFSTAGTGRANGAHNNTWLNNVAYNNNAGFLIRQSQNPTLKNNISVNNARVQFLTIAGYTISPVFKNNLSWKTGAVQGSTAINNWNCALVAGSDSACTNTTAADETFNAWVTAAAETGAVFGNPLFVNPDSATYDFHLQAGSPAVGTGLSGVDIGAYPEDSPAPPTPDNITIIQIASGQSIYWGDSVPIHWQSNFADNVTLQVSYDGGTSYSTILPNIANDGAENWTVTGPASTNVKFKAIKTTNPAVFDVTDNTLTILGIYAK